MITTFRLLFVYFTELLDLSMKGLEGYANIPIVYFTAVFGQVRR